MVFTCRNNPKRSGKLLFPDCPRFCRLMKTRNRRYPRSSGESGAFLFFRRVPDFCDGRRSFPTNENPNLYRRGRWRWISLITSPINCWAPVPLSQLNVALSQRFGHPRVLGIPIPISLAFWVSPSHITAAFWASPGTLPGCPNP